MKTRRQAAWILFAAWIVAAALAACAPAPATDGISPSEESTTFTPLDAARPTGTATLNPSATLETTLPMEPTATGAAPEIVLPGWVPEGARARLGRGIINQIAVSPDGKTIAVAGATGLFLYRSDTYEEIWSVPTDQGMEKVVFSADGRRIATVTACIQYTWYSIHGGGGDWCDKPVEAIVWSADDADVVQMVDFGNDHINTVAFAQEGEILYVNSFRLGLTAWDVESGEPREVFSYDRALHNSPVAAVFSRDMKRMAESLWHGTVVVSDLANGNIIQTIDDAGDNVDFLTFSPDNAVLAGARPFASSVMLWSVESGAKLWELNGPTGRITALTFSHSGERILAGNDAGNVIQWNAGDGHCQRVYTGPGGSVRSVLFLAEGRFILTAVDAALLAFDAATGNSLPVPEMPFSDWRTVRWRSEGRELALEKDGTVAIWNAEDFSFSRLFSYPRGSVISPDYMMYADASSNGNIVIAYVSSGKVMSTLQAPDYLRGENGFPTVNRNALIFSYDGRMLGTTANNWKVLQGAADIWDIGTGSLLRRLKGFHNTIGDRTKLVFSADGRLAAVAVFDGSRDFISVFETATGKQINVFSNQLDWIFAFSEDGKTLITGCDWYEGPGSVCLYDIYAGDRRLAYSQEFYPFNMKADAIYNLAISPGETFAAAGTLWGNILIWDGTKDQLLHTFRGHTAQVDCLVFSPDGTSLASASADGSVVVWDLDRLS
jgi:WD40 repeat protein